MQSVCKHTLATCISLQVLAPCTPPWVSIQFLYNILHSNHFHACAVHCPLCSRSDCSQMYLCCLKVYAPPTLCVLSTAGSWHTKLNQHVGTYTIKDWRIVFVFKEWHNSKHTWCVVLRQGGRQTSKQAGIVIIPLQLQLELTMDSKDNATFCTSCNIYSSSLVVCSPTCTCVYVHVQCVYNIFDYMCIIQVYWYSLRLVLDPAGVPAKAPTSMHMH